MEKHSVSRLSYLFSHLHLLSAYSFSSTLLSSNLSLLSASSLLCFSSVHIVGSLTSKLPSNSLDSLGHSHSLDLFGASTVVSDVDALETSDNTIFFTIEIT